MPESGIWLDRPEVVLLPDVSLNLLNCPFNILFKFLILKQDTRLAFEFHLYFQKLQEYQMIGSSLLLAEFIRNPDAAFEFLLEMNMYTGY